MNAMAKKSPKVLFLFGTRPEAIKMAPLIKTFNSPESGFKTVVAVTAQHRQMLDQVLSLFDIVPNHDLDLMMNNQKLSSLSAKAMLGVTEILESEGPEMLMVQGDTTTALIAVLAAYYLKIPIAHIEAGLRTGNKYAPFPEEMNRNLISPLADFHFAPTERAKMNLLSEGIPESKICVSGNTVIDALMSVIEKQRSREAQEELQKYFLDEFNIDFIKQTKIILVTGHRRESFGRGFENICIALSTLGLRHPDFQIIYPVHLNPNVQKPVYSILGDIKNIHLIPPLDYAPFIFLMEKSYLIFTDSGGIQEEAPSLGKPVLILREITERPEGIESGTARLVGTNIDKILGTAERLLFDQSEYNKMAKATNPYGNGQASRVILEYLRSKFTT